MANEVSSSYSYLSSSSTTRFSGLVSGMDTESIVEKLMKAESAQMEKLQQQKQKYEWQRTAYRDVNTQLDTFEKGLFDKFGLKSSLVTKAVSVSDSSKVSVTAGSGASGTLNLQSVTRLASSASVVGNNTSFTKNTDLLGLGNGKVELNVIQSDGSMKKTTVDYTSSDTVESFTKRLNSSGAGVTALFSSGKMSLTANATGEATGGAIQVLSDTNGTTGVFQKLGFETDAAGAILKDGLAVNGQNAKYTINGLDMESTSNQFSLSGYTVTLKETFNQSAITTPPVTISSSTDIDAMVDKVKEFVTMYNDLITSLNTQVKEKKNLTYKPLTDAEKAAMSEDQITKWEEKAKAGIIKGDSTIKNVLASLRQTVYTDAGSSSKLNALYEIGITTTTSYNDGGLLEIDENVLREKLSEDPDAVADIFLNSQTGIVTSMRTAAKSAITTIEEKAGKASSVDTTYSLGKQLMSIDERIANWKERLEDIEKRYWNQFSAMESAISKANSQASLFSTV